MEILIPNTKRNPGLTLGAVVFLFLTLFCSKAILSIEVRLIESPKPTHVEKNFKKLIKVKEITGEIDQDHFLAQPISLTADGDGNIFLYDRLLVKIFKLDKELRYVTDFGRKGRGPGDINGFGYSTDNLYFSKNGYLYFHCPGNHKIMQFDTEGKLKMEIKKGGRVSLRSVPTVVDKKGNFYILTEDTPNAVVVKYSSSFNKISSFLTHDHLREYIIFKPFPKILVSRSMPRCSNTFYDVLGNDRFIIYLSNSSTVFIFKGSKLIKQFRLWPKNATELYKEGVAYRKAKLKKLNAPNNWFIPFATSFFVDRDNEKFFYIDLSGKRGLATLYKFDTDGNLITVFTHKAYGNFKAKRNNLFYGLNEADGDIFVYKEEFK